jgi:hypothetical protein
VKKFAREVVGTASAVVILPAMEGGDYQQALVQVCSDPDILKTKIKGRNKRHGWSAINARGGRYSARAL